MTEISLPSYLCHSPEAWTVKGEGNCWLVISPKLPVELLHEGVSWFVRCGAFVLRIPKRHFQAENSHDADKGLCLDVVEKLSSFVCPPSSFFAIVSVRIVQSLLGSRCPAQLAAADGTVSSCKGDIMPDLTAPLSLHLRALTAPATIPMVARDAEKERGDSFASFELKPKSLLLPSQCFVVEEEEDKDGEALHSAKQLGVHPLKHQFCRFSMMQFFKRSGKASKFNVKRNAAKPSQYCPLDLASRVPERVAKAINALLESGQSNLKVFPNTPLEEQRSTGARFSEVLTALLCQSEVLPILVAIQAANVIDIELLSGIVRKETGNTGSSRSCSRKIFIPQSQESCECQCSLLHGSPAKKEKARQLVQDVLQASTTYSKECLYGVKAGNGGKGISSNHAVQPWTAAKEKQEIERFYSAAVAKDCSLVVSIERTSRENCERLFIGSVSSAGAFPEGDVGVDVDAQRRYIRTALDELIVSKSITNSVSDERRELVVARLRDIESCYNQQCLLRSHRHCDDACISQQQKALLGSSSLLFPTSTENSNMPMGEYYLVGNANEWFLARIAVIDLESKMHKSLSDYAEHDAEILQAFISGVVM